MKNIETNRLILRLFTSSDADDLLTRRDAREH